MLGRIDSNKDFIAVEEDIILVDGENEFPVHISLNRKDLLRFTQKVMAYVKKIQGSLFEGEEDDFDRLDDELLEFTKKYIDVSVIQDKDKQINTILQVYKHISDGLEK